MTRRQRKINQWKQRAMYRLYQLMILFMVVGGFWLFLNIVIGAVHYALDADEMAAQFTPQYLRQMERDYVVE